MASAADLLARRLYRAGCRHAFGIPGGEVLTLLRALEAAGIRFVLTKHENGAGFMAEGAHHRDGAPGILLATLGPGVVNAVNVVANAEQDRVPLIVLSGCVDEAEAASYTHQVMDHQAVFRPITKASFRLAPGNAADLADKAVAIALEGRPGPVHIDVPIGVALEEAGPAPAGRAPDQPTAPAEGPALEQARTWLAEAEKPIMLAGLDVLNEDAASTLQRFSADYGVPVITSYKAKGVLPEDDPFSLGGAGLSPVADGHLLPLVREADLILAVGYDPIEMRTGWRHPWDPAKQRVIEFAAAANHHYMHQSGLSFVCHVGAGLEALRQGSPKLSAWDPARFAATRTAIRQDLSAAEDWGPAAITETVRQVLPRNGIATVDSGAHRILLSQLWDCYEPRSLLQSTGLCTMGCALPLAIGAKIAEPGRDVVAFTGDAGLLMILGELATLAELKLPLAVVVFVDESLALIEKKQRERQLPNTGVDFGLPGGIGLDYGAIGRALGGEGITVASRAALAEALEAAFKAERFTVIGCTIPRGAYDGRI